MLSFYAFISTHNTCNLSGSVSITVWWFCNSKSQCANQQSDVIPRKFCNLWTVHWLILAMHQCLSGRKHGVRCQRFKHVASHGFVHFCWDHQPPFRCHLTLVWKFRLSLLSFILASLLLKSLKLTEVPKVQVCKRFCENPNTRSHMKRAQNNNTLKMNMKGKVSPIVIDFKYLRKKKK